MKEAYSSEELARKTGMTVRGIRYYIAYGILPNPQFRGVATTYSRQDYLRIRAVQQMKRQERLKLAAIRKRLARLTPADLEAYAPPPPPVPAPPTAPALDPAMAPPEGAVRWDRVELVPGLELSVRSDAPALVRRLAREIREAYGAAPLPAPPS